MTPNLFFSSGYWNFKGKRFISFYFKNGINTWQRNTDMLYTPSVPKREVRYAGESNPHQSNAETTPVRTGVRHTCWLAPRRRRFSLRWSGHRKRRAGGFSGTVQRPRQTGSGRILPPGMLEAQTAGVAPKSRILAGRNWWLWGRQTALKNNRRPVGGSPSGGRPFPFYSEKRCLTPFF